MRDPTHHPSGKTGKHRHKIFSLINQPYRGLRLPLDQTRTRSIILQGRPSAVEGAVIISITLCSSLRPSLRRGYELDRDRLAAALGRGPGLGLAVG
jgi:hypothetical protein